MFCWAIPLSSWNQAGSLCYFCVMEKNRMEAFSDGVIAIIITIMVLEMHVPQGASLSALKPILPIFLCYILSFVYVGIYWNNHHHMLHSTKRVSGGILWVVSLSLAGYYFGRMPFVKDHFQYVVIAIVVISVLPAVVHALRGRREIGDAEGLPNSRIPNSEFPN